ncbi:MAG: hypothetical protein IPG72_04660 [Ardenticatenales bacterium]|nr:hypothetical protein [Ardenticatenales bacterium]
MFKVTVMLPDEIRDAAGRQGKSVELLVQQLVDAYLEERDDDALVEDLNAREAAGLSRVREFAAFAAELGADEND